MSGRAGSSQPEGHHNHFTRGEKCIFTHLVVTFSLILLTIIIYFVHLCVVNHSLHDVWKITRRSATTPKERGWSRACVGAVVVREGEERVACGAVLVRARWSAAPAHCAAARTDPDLAPLLHAWAVRYLDQQHTLHKSGIKRSLPHPHFDRDQFGNNVGLLEHLDDIPLAPLFLSAAPAGVTDPPRSARLVSWQRPAAPSHSDTGEGAVVVEQDVLIVPRNKCVQFMAPILELRTYEMCVLLTKKEEPYPEHGSALIVEDKIIGLFAWGEKTGKGTPCIVLQLEPYKEWLENIMVWAQ